MQLQSTFGAFLVAFTMVHGAPMIAQADQPPALWGIEQDAGLNPVVNLSIKEKHGKPNLDKLGALDMASIVARDVKRSPPRKGKSNEVAKAKGAEAGKKTVAGLKSILDDKLDEDSEDEKLTEPCGGKEDEEDKEKDDKDNDDNKDKDKSGDEEGKEDKDKDEKDGDEKDKEEKKNDKRGLRARSAPAKRAPPKANKGGSPSKDSSSGKPPGGQQDGGSSIGKDIFTQTTSNVISDGILYGVDEALAEDQPAKRALLKGGSPDTPASQQKRFGGGESAVGVDKLRQMSSQVFEIPHEIPSSDISEDDTVAAATDKRSRRGRGGRYRFNSPKFFPGSTPGQRKDIDIPPPTTDLSGGDQVINPDEPATAAPPQPPVKRSPKGGSSRGWPGSRPDDGRKDVDRRPAFETPAPPPADIWPGINVDEAIAGQGAGPQQDTAAAAAAAAAPPVKRSPRGGRFRGVGTDIATDVVSDGISKGIWYGVDEAAAATNNEKRSGGLATATEAEGRDIVNGGLDRMELAERKHRPKCAGKPGLCSWGKPPRPDVDLVNDYTPPLAGNSDVKLAVEPDLTVVGGRAVQKRQKGKGNKGKGPSRSPSPGSPTKTEPKTQPQTQPQSQPQTQPQSQPKTDSNPAQAPAQAPASGGGFVQGTKDAAIDIGTGAATGIIVAGVEQAIAPAQPTETVVVEAPPAEAAPAPAEAPAPAPAPVVRRRAVRFAA